VKRDCLHLLGGPRKRRIFRILSFALSSNLVDPSRVLSPFFFDTPVRVRLAAFDVNRRRPASLSVSVFLPSSPTSFYSGPSVFARWSSGRLAAVCNRYSRKTQVGYGFFPCPVFRVELAFFSLSLASFPSYDSLLSKRGGKARMFPFPHDVFGSCDRVVLVRRKGLIPPITSDSPPFPFLSDPPLSYFF